MIGACELRTLLLSRQHLERLPPARDDAVGVRDQDTGREYRTGEAEWARLIEPCGPARAGR
jgi:hypothetical protein